MFRGQNAQQEVPGGRSVVSTELGALAFLEGRDWVKEIAVASQRRTSEL
jgi:hypothetical protein